MTLSEKSNPDFPPLRLRIKAYRKQLHQIDLALKTNPERWGRFQSQFNQEVNFIFREIMLYEKKALSAHQEDNLYRLKNFFVRRLRKDFLYGRYIVWSLKKPYGYAGDFQIIDDLYRNDPDTKGVDRLFDNYAQMSAMAIAIRNRKKDVKQFLTSFISRKAGKKFYVMDLASGPCRDISEFLSESPLLAKKVHFDCYDQDLNAIEYAKNLLGTRANCVSFFQENALRLALRKDIDKKISRRYDFIYSLGLFDYLDEKIALRLIAALKRLLTKNGQLLVANVSEKYENPSCHFLEWVGEWELVYRNQATFRKLFIEAGFPPESLTVDYEQQGIIQYILARNQ